jgi:vancomycin resistance protein VanJ
MSNLSTSAVGRPAGRRSRRRRPALTLLVITASLGLALLLGAHALVPDVAGLGLILDTALPWLGWLIPVLALMALAAHTRGARFAVLVPAVVWGFMFIPVIVPLGFGGPASAASAAAPGASAGTLTVASQNVQAGSGTAGDSALTLAETGADVIALQELDNDSLAAARAALDATYPHYYGIGTVGMWSKFPILNAQPWDLGLGWQRALAADLDTPAGLVSIYVIHAGSARPGDHAQRDAMLTNLAGVLPNDENERVIAVGDFNAASNDRSFEAITRELTEPNQTNGLFGFTWPAGFPAARLDHFLQRGMTVTANTVLPAGDSDHLAILTSLNL